jgi:hypothetical protein
MRPLKLDFDPMKFELAACFHVEKGLKSFHVCQVPIFQLTQQFFCGCVIQNNTMYGYSMSLEAKLNPNVQSRTTVLLSCCETLK